MRQLLLSCLLLVMGAIAYGQTKVEFTYDTAGNRTARQIVPLNKSAFLNEKTALAEDKMGERTVKLFPNPTYGVLTLEMGNLAADEKVAVQVTDMKGRTLLKKEHKTASFKIDLTAQPKGFYILSANIGTERKEWKIIKE